MSIRKLAATGAALSILGSPGMVLAEMDSPHDFSANMALTTNYMFRGISQTDNGPAIQGGFDYKYNPYDLYIGVWASNVDGSSGGYNGAGMELDLYAGWAPSWQDIGFDLGYIRYQYPKTKTTENHTDEFHLGLSYDIFGYFTPGYTVHYSDDYFGGGPAWYYDLGVEIPLPYDFMLAGHYGWNRFDDSSGNYRDYSVGISRKYLGLGLDLSWVDRTVEEACSWPLQCGNTLVFTLSKSF